MSVNQRLAATLGIVLLVCATGIFTTASAQGIMIPGVGPINRAMGGASVAAPLDAIGAIHWNPAAISGLASSELEFGVELLLPDLEVSSTVGPTSGKTGAEPGVSPIPSIGWVHHSTSNSRITYGLGVMAVAGFQTNYPADPNNPVFSPAFGGGQTFSRADFLQIVPTISYAVTDQLSVGFAPTVTMANVSITPAAFAAPNAGGALADAEGTRWTWGGGAQLGVYYLANRCWHFGASIKSPVWFEPFRYHASDAIGAPRRLELDIELPMIVSLGASYSGYENLILALDVRYFDYKNTKLWGEPSNFGPNGEISGLGWSNVFSVSAGGQYRLNDCTYLRAGYSYNSNPIRSSDAIFNVATPLFYQHVLSAGASRDVTEFVAISMFVVYAPDSSADGPVRNPASPLPGNVVPNSSVSTELGVYAIGFGTTVSY